MLDFDPQGRAQETDPERLVLVCVVGSNQELADACRANLERLCPDGYYLQECVSSETSRGCDVYVWDVESSPSVPNAMTAAEGAIKIIIVKKRSLSSLRRKLSGPDFMYLQNPVTSLSLRAVWDSAIAQLKLRRSDGVRSASLKLDRDKLLQQLLQTNLKLREHDQERANFLARSVHDIRVPLMAVQGYCGLLLAGQVGPMDPEQTQILERIQRSLTRLCRLVEAMMDLGAGSPAQTKLRLGNGSIDACVQQAVHEVLPYIENKQICLNADVEAPEGPLLFDSEQLEQVLVNLLDNACKFTPKGGSITIKGRSIASDGLDKAGWLENTAGYRIDITDTGRGINSDHLEQVFDEHTSFGDTMDRSGSGLGLAICRMIIQAHHGRIWANPGTQGASFSFVLPSGRSFSDSHLSSVAI